MTNFLWRRRRNRNRPLKKEALEGIIISDVELTIPTHFRCPISLDLMKDPVSLSTGITYDRENIEKWIDSGNATCPMTNQVLNNLDQIPNHSIRKMIQKWCVDNKPYGIERISTPRVPITTCEVSRIRSAMIEAAKSHDEKKCRELVKRINDLAKESERNRHCFVSNGCGSALVDVFESFARLSGQKYENLLREVLSALTWSFPLGEEGVSKLESRVFLRCMAWYLNDDDLSVRRDAVFVLKEMIFADENCEDGLVGIEEALFRVMKVPICPKATQACLVVIHHMMILQGEKSAITTSRFVEMGLIPLIPDIIVEGNIITCEKAIGVLDSICNLKQGKESAYLNALTIPLAVKKILHVSSTGTELLISILWKIIVRENENALIEAVQLGAFEKLLIVLQVGCGERTKEKVTELLKLMNMYRDKLDCFDSSMGYFKQMKRP